MKVDLGGCEWKFNKEIIYQILKLKNLKYF